MNHTHPHTGPTVPAHTLVHCVITSEHIVINNARKKFTNNEAMRVAMRVAIDNAGHSMMTQYDDTLRCSPPATHDDRANMSHATSYNNCYMYNYIHISGELLEI